MTRTPLLPIVAALCLLAAAPPSPAQSTTTTPAPATRPSQYDRALTVSPAAADGVAGSFAYSQQTLDLRDENAAPLYLQAFIVSPQWSVQNSHLWNDVYDVPPDERDSAAAEALLAQYFTAFEVCEPAVRRTWSDFGSPLREKGIATLLPYLNESRVLANAMDLSIDYQRLGGNRAGAEEMTRRLFVLGGHIGNSRRCLFVDGLVGVGIAAQAAKQATQLAEMPGAPNRYWAVTTLPRPMFDTAAWLSAERSMLLYTFPALRDPESMTAERLSGVLMQLQGWVSSDAGDAGALASTPEAFRQAVDSFTISLAGAQFLHDRGYTAEQIAAANVAGEVTRVMLRDYNDRYDAVARSFRLPFPQGYPLIVREEQRLAAEPRQDLPFPSFADVMMPSLSRAYAVTFRLERQLDALRIVEAVRDYAADHGGLPPATLDGCRLPVPADPMTGRAFGYEVDGRTFRVVGESYDESDPDAGFTWTVTLRE